MDSATVRHILVRHEQGAGHAAEGYAHATGRVGVCLATSGPGATNLVTPIADAYMDSVPMVAITGQVPSGAIGTDAFQEADISGITIPITKHNYLVTDPAEIPRAIAEAFPSRTIPGRCSSTSPRTRCRRTTPGPPGSMPGCARWPGHAKQVREAAGLWPDPACCTSAAGVVKRGPPELRRLVDVSGAPVVTP
jgi:acetolactate synthase-1/2/3 large subunit